MSGALPSRVAPPLLLAASLLASAGSQAATGSLTGVVRDTRGDAVPGVTLTVTAGDRQRTAVTDVSGRFLFEELPAATYGLEATLAGFRRETREAILVQTGRSTAVELVLRVGAFEILDYVVPDLPTAARTADVIAHVRMLRAVATTLPDVEAAVVTTEHHMRLIEVVKADLSDARAGAVASFDQQQAGVIDYEGRRLVGKFRIFPPGSEHVALMARDPQGRLTGLAGDHLTFAVIDGRVRYRGAPDPDVRDGMPVREFLAVLRHLASR